MTVFRKVSLVILIAAVFMPAALLLGGCPEEGGGVECGPPITYSGEDLEGSIGRTVILQGTVRLPPEDEQVCLTEKDTLTFTWEQISGPDAELLDGNQREAAFIPEVDGVYKFRFMATYPPTDVNKEAKPSQWDTVTINVATVICGEPAADAGADQDLSTPAGTAVSAVLDGSGSHSVHQLGCACDPITCAWTQTSGANAPITDGDQCVASVQLPDVGVYEFQLQVTDSCGTDGRTDTHTDTVTITVVEREPCGATLAVTVIDALSGAPLSGAHVTVVDAGDNAQTGDTDASGVAALSGLTAGTRKFITAVSDETAPAIKYLDGAPARARYETTTLVDHCAASVTIPLQETRSGEWAGEYGTVKAKVPAEVYALLPHSWKCAGDCKPEGVCQGDYCCDETYYCEMEETTPCGPIPENPEYGSCTPRSLLPFFSLGDNNISGQFRVVITTPLFPLDNFAHFPVERLFAPPPGADALLPGNLTTDDTFLNGLAPSLGLDPWGGTCVRTADCPNDKDYVCEEDPQGDHRCKDKNPLRNLEMVMPTGSNRIFVTLGIIDVNMMDLLPVLLPFLTSDSEVEFDVGALLGAFKMRTMHICPITVNVAAGDNDISAALAGLSLDDCWSIDYQQKDSTIALKDPSASGADSCTTDADCCDNTDPPNCGWPASGKKCLPDPDVPGGGGALGCYMPMFRVEVLSGDEVQILPPTGGFDVTANKSDARLCSHVPATAEFEVMCETATEGIFESCNPRDIRNLDVPSDHQCSLPYGLALSALDIPVGHAALPEGGRVLIGFNFNRTPFSENDSPKFLVPNLAANGLTGASISVVQLYMRNVTTMPDGAYDSLPGYLGATASSASNAATMQLADFVPFLAPSNVPDAGIDVKVTFVAKDPSVFPPNLEKAYADARNIPAPTAGTHNLPGSVTFTVDASHELIGLLLHKVDRVDNYEITDRWWRIFAPPSTTTITLPASVDPFASGDEVWLGLFGASFRGAFDYDLFRTDPVIKAQAAHTKDSYALIKP